MNKQALSTLSVQQLRQCKENLAKRIDDLKFFNLDLGRTNISLSEQYRELRQKADKVQKGKMPKLTKAKGYHKNIYLQHQPKPNQHNAQVNRNNFNFNDLYKLSKNKISSWIWQKPKKHEEIQLPNQQQYHQNYMYHQQQYAQPEVMYYQQVIVGDFPPAQVMKLHQDVEKDPLEQEVGFIVKHVPVIKVIQNQESQRDPIQQEIIQIIRQADTQEQRHEQLEHQMHKQNEVLQGQYQRLYHPQQNDNYIHEERQRQIQQHQKYMMSQQQPIYQNQAPREYQKSQEPQPKPQSKNPTMKTFEFDDLPGMGWKKLKGLIGWGSKNKKEQQTKSYQAPMHQQQVQYMVPQPQNNMGPVHGSTINTNPPVQRKRTPIFGSGMNSNFRETQQYQEENHSMKQARIQKQLSKEERIQSGGQVNNQESHGNKREQLGVDSKLEQGVEKQEITMRKHDSI